MVYPAALLVTWLIAAPVGAAVSAPVGAPAAKAEATAAATAEATAEDSPLARRTLKALPANLLAGTAGVWSRATIWPLAVGAAVTGAAAPFDARVRRAVASPGAQFGTVLQAAGNTLATSAGVLSLYGIGALAHSERLQAMSYDMVEGTIVAGVLTTGLKYAVHRERPDGSNHSSFPSGHSSNAFVLATIAEMHYGWKIGVPSYLGAAAIAYSRMVHDKHYLSDCLAGATLGVIVGRAVVRQNNRPIPGRSAASTHAMWSVVPVIQNRGGGLIVTIIVP